MAKNIHTATLPDGTVANRTSASRTYTHCIAARRSYEHALSAADRLSDQDRKNFDYYLACHEGTHEHANSPYTSDEQRASWARTAAFGNRDAYAEHLRSERVAKVEREREMGCFTRWIALGWSGSLSLAQKAASAESGRGGYYAEVKILPAELGAR